MISNFKLLFFAANILLSCFNSYGQHKEKPLPTSVLYDKVLNDKGTFPELIKTDAAQFGAEGLKITGKGSLQRLNYYYSLAERVIRYQVKFSSDSKSIFQSDGGDFKAFVDISNKKISIGTNPVIEKKVDFIDFNHEYLIEIKRSYQTSTLRIIDVYTGQSAEIEGTMDGAGGTGAGAISKGFYVGLQHDYYCFGLESGSAFSVKRITVFSALSGLKLLLYGDSITEPEGYFPTSEFGHSWTQLIIKNVKGKAMASGRGGTTINEVLLRIKNELPYIKSKYVMVTIGTNGGNTEQKLSELVEYIIAQGAIPILNNIPSNESGSQVPVNEQIEKIRNKYGIKGCKFDLATSVNRDGKKVDEATMWFEDYGTVKIYHHPNTKGSLQMYTQTLIDIPEIYY